MDSTVKISAAAKQLGVSSHYLRLLEWEDRIPPARRGRGGRVYTSSDIAFLRSMGVGSRPRKLRRAEEVLDSPS